MPEEPDPRFTLANERTFLAWNRTALALVAGGLAAVQFLNVGYHSIRYIVSIPLVVLGGWVALASLRRWRSIQAALRAGEPLPGSRLPQVLAVSVGLLSVLGAVIAVLDLTR